MVLGEPNNDFTYSVQGGLSRDVGARSEGWSWESVVLPEEPGEDSMSKVPTGLCTADVCSLSKQVSLARTSIMPVKHKG